MSDRDRLYLSHILRCISRVETYTRAGRAAYDSETIIQDAVIRNLQVIGESAKRLSQELCAAASEIPWKDVVGLRNVLVHDYLGVDLDSVWEIASNDLPGLRAAIHRLLGEAD